VRAPVERIEEAKTEFEEHEDAYADHMQDEWKERWRDERDSDCASRTCSAQYAATAIEAKQIGSPIQIVLSWARQPTHLVTVLSHAQRAGART
jgi:hypothetical protein